MIRLKYYIQLSRPVNCAIAFLSVFIGGFITGTVHTMRPLLMAALSGTLITAGANAINDVFDVEIDRRNKPHRPLPSGRLSGKQASLFAASAMVLGVLLAVFINTAALFVASVSAVLLYYYSRLLKRTAIWGNLTVALVTGTAFLYGGLAVGRWERPLIVAVFAFLFHWAREIVKDMEDMKGDRESGIRTLPIQRGVRVSLVWITVILGCLILFTWVPAWTGIFSRPYVWVVVPGVNGFIVVLLLSLWKNPSRRNLARWAVLMKVDMLIGLLAVYLGS
ncbi:MAG TPA: digeranylgeranylglyceryl phosphate synthase [bacterium]|nr:digeranylgeranylglyceryl phosphate synthase [bacterium]